jgi:hypothetical protein
MKQPDLHLWPIGNCQVSALIDCDGRFVWGCVPRVDGDPAFSSLLRSDSAYDEKAHGYWSIELEDCVSIHQESLSRDTSTPMARKLKSSISVRVCDG